MKVDMNSIVVSGMSYLVNGGCGAVSRSMHAICSGPKEASAILEVKGFIQDRPKNWRRFDQVSLMTFAASLWACVDAGLSFAQEKSHVGLVGFDQTGSLDPNRLFFKDYVDAGRSGARSNLFVYTLPTTPLAEVALFCGFTGPVWHMYQPLDGVYRLLEDAALCAAQDEVHAMLAVCANAQEAVCFVVQKGQGQKLFALPFVQERLKGLTAVKDILKALEVSYEGKESL